MIELEDGRICSCSWDKTIRIWDNNTYQSITTLTAHTDWILSIIEMNDSIISVSVDKRLRRWNKSTYEFVQVFKDVYCCCPNSLEKLNNHTLLLGGIGVIFVVDIKSSNVKQFEDNTLGRVLCFRVIRNDLVLFGNSKGEICEYNPSSNQIISKSKFHNQDIICFIGQNQLISSPTDGTINIYQYL